nr:MAG TPA: peptidase [Microviridae sp.]
MDTAEFVNKFYTECQNKREVINPYTGDIILVPYHGYCRVRQ